MCWRNVYAASGSSGKWLVKGAGAFENGDAKKVRSFTSCLMVVQLKHTTLVCCSMLVCRAVLTYVNVPISWGSIRKLRASMTHEF